MFGQIDDRTDDLAAFFMREHDSAEHLLFGQFFRFGLNHHHRVLRRGNHQVEIALVTQRIGDARVEDIFAIIGEAHARSADRAHERNTRNGQRSRCRDHRNDIRLGLAIIGQDLADDVDFVVETFREERAHRTVDQTRSERFFFRRAAFALEKAARNTAGGREFFLIVNGQREEVLAFLDALGGGHGAQHHGFAIGGQTSAVSVPGTTAGFQSEGRSAPLQRYGFRVEH